MADGKEEKSVLLASHRTDGLLNEMGSELYFPSTCGRRVLSPFIVMNREVIHPYLSIEFQHLAF